MLHLQIDSTDIICVEEPSEKIILTNKQSNKTYTLPIRNADLEGQFRCYTYIINNDSEYTGDPSIVEGVTKCNLPVGMYTYVAGEEKGLLQVGELKDAPVSYNKDNENSIYYEPR